MGLKWQLSRQLRKECLAMNTTLRNDKDLVWFVAAARFLGAETDYTEVSPARYCNREGPVGIIVSRRR